MEVVTKSASETAGLGKKIATSLKGGDVLALVGDLGSGKTTFVQGVAEGLGVDQRIISPTFILVREYEIPVSQKKSFSKLYHVDLYRIDDEIEEELKNLGIDDVAADKKSILVVEWADKAKDLFSDDTKWITFESTGENERSIKIE